jgi:hypothetical protein
MALFDLNCRCYPMDFLHCYRILGLTPECDWEQARHHYKQLVSRLHPDRPTASVEGPSLTDINRAWRQLRKYYQQHGQMPLQTTDGNPAHLPVTPFETVLTPIRKHHRIRILAVLAAATVFLILFSYRVPPPTQANAEAAIISSPSPPAARQPATASIIRHGDPLGHVVETLGPPQDTRGSRWYYGDSWIELREGRVSDWHSSVDYPLPTDTLSYHRQR